MTKLGTERYYHNKIVRDRIPEIIKMRGGSFEANMVSKKKARVLLRKKLYEEVEEVVEAKNENLLKELSDVLELIKTIGELEGIEFNDIRKKARQVEKLAGSYKKRIYLAWPDKPQGWGDRHNK